MRFWTNVDFTHSSSLPRQSEPPSVTIVNSIVPSYWILYVFFKTFLNVSWLKHNYIAHRGRPRIDDDVFNDDYYYHIETFGYMCTDIY